MAEKLNLNEYQTVDRIPGEPGMLEGIPKDGSEPVHFKESSLVSPMKQAERRGYNMMAEDLKIEVPEDKWPESENENLETQGFPKKAKWDSVHDDKNIEAKVLGKYKDGSYLIELTKEINGSLQHRVPARELKFTEGSQTTPEETPDSPEIQALKDEITQLRNELEQQEKKLTEVIAELKATVDDLRKQLVEAKGETVDDKEEFEWEPEKGDGVFVKAADGSLDSNWTIVKVEGEDDNRKITARKDDDPSKEVTESYEQFLKWQIEAGSIEEENEDKELKLGQKVRAYSRAREKFEDDWEIKAIYFEGNKKMVLLNKPGSSNKLKGEPKILPLVKPYDMVLAWQLEKSDSPAKTPEEEKIEEGEQPAQRAGRLRALWQKFKEQYAGRTTRFLTGDVVTTEEQQATFRKGNLIRRYSGMLAILGTGAVIGWLASKGLANGDEHQQFGGLDIPGVEGSPDGQSPDNGGTPTPENDSPSTPNGGESSDQGKEGSTGMGNIYIDGGSGDDTINVYPEGVESHTGNGSSSAGDGETDAGDNSSGSEYGETEEHGNGEDEESDAEDESESDSGAGDERGSDNNGLHLDFWGPDGLSAVELPNDLHLETNTSGGTDIVDEHGNHILENIGQDRQGNLDVETRQQLEAKDFKLEQKIMEDRGVDGGDRYYTSVSRS